MYQGEGSESFIVVHTIYLISIYLWKSSIRCGTYHAAGRGIFFRIVDSLCPKQEDNWHGSQPPVGRNGSNLYISANIYSNNLNHSHIQNPPNPSQGAPAQTTLVDPASPVTLELEQA